MKPDLSQLSDIAVLRLVAEERPQFGDALAALIDKGHSDEEIVRMVADADGSGQAMHYAAKCLRALRSLQA